MKKKIGLFGGSFNPIHNAHVDKVKDALSSGLIDEVWIIPCRKHAFDKELLDSELRIDMINLSFEGVSNVKVCREEVDFEGMSYALDTVRRLKSKFDHDFVWLGGSDLLYDINKWYHYKDFFDMVEFIIFERKGYPIIEVDGMKILGILKDNMSGFSSSEVRLRCLEGESISNMVDPKVRKYILDKNLYKKVYLA